MVVYRITRKQYAGDLSGEGARRFGGRWNHRGVPALYTSATESLAALEVLVHATVHLLPSDLMLIKLRIPDKEPIHRLDADALPENWREYPAPAALAEIGTNWLKEQNGWILNVPSVVIPSERNFILNSHHQNYRKMEVLEERPFAFDVRLLR